MSSCLPERKSSTRASHSGSKSTRWPAVSSDGRYVYFEYAAGEPSSYAGHDDPLQGFFQIKRIELRTGDKEDVTSGRAAADAPSTINTIFLLSYLAVRLFNYNLWHVPGAKD